MKVTIWDLDYYYAKDKTNCFNPDAMKISSYHKQKGDSVNFVVKPDDIYRPFDLYYIIKENSKTPNAPLDFYTNCKVRWWGKAYRVRINWKMPDIMLACRPDYLLYPEKNTSWEKAEQIRFLNSDGELLPIKQDWRNAFTGAKKAIVTDTKLWTTSSENLKTILVKLQNILNVTFFEPIWLPKIASDKNIKDLFLKLHVQRDSNIRWIPITMDQYPACVEILQEIKKKWKNIKIGPLIIKLFTEDHWDHHDAALEDWNRMKKIIVDAKKKKIHVELKMIKSRMDTPYFLLFETMSNWTHKKPEISWIEWITQEHGGNFQCSNREYWSHEEKWHEVFRDLLRQTYFDPQFLTTQWGDRVISENDLPWQKWQEVFKYGL